MQGGVCGHAWRRTDVQSTRIGIFEPPFLAAPFLFIASFFVTSVRACGCCLYVNVLSVI